MPALKKEIGETVYTSEDFWALPDGERAELIDGKIYNMAPPSFMHQKLLMKMAKSIDNYIDAHNGGCDVIPAPFAVNLTGNDRTWVEPDISVICDPQKISERGCEGAPDWIVEIVSPGTKRMDYMVKLFKYRMAGVREYWIVDPAKQQVFVYSFEGDEDYAEYSFEDRIPSGIYEGFSVRIGDLLA